MERSKLPVKFVHTFFLMLGEDMMILAYSRD